MINSNIRGINLHHKMDLTCLTGRQSTIQIDFFNPADIRRLEDMFPDIPRLNGLWSNSILCGSPVQLFRSSENLSFAGSDCRIELKN